LLASCLILLTLGLKDSRCARMSQYQNLRVDCVMVKFENLHIGKLTLERFHLH
jgi:hypothetical protein